jgi:translocator protein
MDSTWIPVTAAVAFWASVATLGALVTDIGPWYRALKQPAWKPRDALFGPIWTTVFVSAGYGCILAWNGGGTAAQRKLFLIACALNGLGNLWWSWLFFRSKRPDWAMWQVFPFYASIWFMYWTTRPLAHAAGIWFAPYLLWVTAAIYLNWCVVKLNAPFRGR